MDTATIYLIKWILIFTAAFALEAWHDAYRGKYLDKNCKHDFLKSRISKIIKGIGWTVAMVLIAYLANDYWLILHYWIQKNIMFHPLLRIHTHGFLFVFSWEGIIWMLRHSEIYYWLQLLLGNRNICPVCGLILQRDKSELWYWCQDCKKHFNECEFSETRDGL